MPTDVPAETGSYVCDGYSLSSGNWEKIEGLGGYKKFHVKVSSPPAPGTIKIYRKGVAAPVEITLPGSSNVIVNRLEGSGFEIDIEPSS